MTLPSDSELAPMLPLAARIGTAALKGGVLGCMTIMADLWLDYLLMPPQGVGCRSEDEYAGHQDDPMRLIFLRWASELVGGNDQSREAVLVSRLITAGYSFTFYEWEEEARAAIAREEAAGRPYVHSGWIQLVDTNPRHLPSTCGRRFRWEEGPLDAMPGSVAVAASRGRAWAYPMPRKFYTVGVPVPLTVEAARRFDAAGYRLSYLASTDRPGGIDHYRLRPLAEAVTRPVSFSHWLPYGLSSYPFVATSTGSQVHTLANPDCVFAESDSPCGRSPDSWVGHAVQWATPAEVDAALEAAYTLAKKPTTDVVKLERVLENMLVKQGQHTLLLYAFEALDSDLPGAELHRRLLGQAAITRTPDLIEPVPVKLPTVWTAADAAAARAERAARVAAAEVEATLIREARSRLLAKMGEKTGTVGTGGKVALVLGSAAVLVLLLAAFGTRSRRGE